MSTVLQLIAAKSGGGESIRRVKRFTADVLGEWRKDKGWLLSAALAFYSLFSLAPLLILMVAATGILLGWSNAEERIIAHVRSLTGEAGTAALQQLILDISPPRRSLLAAGAGVLALVMGASTVFFQMRQALDVMWNVEPPRRKFFFGYLRQRISAFLIAVAAGFLMIVSLLSTTLLAALERRLEPAFGEAVLVWRVFDISLAWAVLLLIFAMLYKFVPDTKVLWSDVWIGALTATILFNIAKYLMGLYLGFTSVGSAYGAAGSVIVFLVWVNVSAQIFLLGGECVQVFARNRKKS